MNSSLNRRQTLYRRLLLCVTCTLLVASACAQGGQRDDKGRPTQDIPQTQQTSSPYAKRKGPRAIAVVRWDADVKDRAVPVLVPVTILDDGQFYDAGIYKAAPAPMPLLVGTVYEAQDKGELLGYFTIKNQAQAPEKKNWIALGAWESAAPSMDKFAGNGTSSAEVVRGALTENTGANPGDDSDDRDLNKKKTTVYDENGKPMPEGTQASPAAPMGGSGKEQPRIKPSDGSAKKSTGSSAPQDNKKPAEDPDRPTIKRQADSSSQPTASSQASKKTTDEPVAASASPARTETSTDDPDRPQLKRGKPATRTTPGGLPQLVDKDKDADRPTIRRNSGKSDQKKEEGIPVPPRVLARGPLLGEGGGDEPTLKRTRTYEAVAVSDANVDQPTNFRYKMTSDEKERLQAKLDALAQEEVDKYLKSIGRPRAGAPVAAGPRSKRATAASRKAKSATPALPGKSLFAETQFEVLDLTHRNDAVLVFSGREREESAGSAAQDVYITYVARIDYEGNPRGIFRSVTVNDRLDVTPKLELIDAIDANGDGKGELLFRRVSDDGAEFAIYKVTFDGMSEMFHGGVAD